MKRSTKKPDAGKKLKITKSTLKDLSPRDGAARDVKGASGQCGRTR